MFDHAWISENLEGYIAGGLHVDERARVDRHVSGCRECAKALAEAREFDQALGNLFAETRPAPGLENRMITALRASSQPRIRWSRFSRFAAGFAAAVLLGLLGFGVHKLALEDGLRFPGELKSPGKLSRATNNLKQIGLSTHSFHDNYRKLPSALEGRFGGEILGSDWSEAYVKGKTEKHDPKSKHPAEIVEGTSNTIQFEEAQELKARIIAAITEAENVVAMTADGKHLASAEAKANGVWDSERADKLVKHLQDIVVETRLKQEQGKSPEPADPRPPVPLPDVGKPAKSPEYHKSPADQGKSKEKEGRENEKKDPSSSAKGGEQKGEEKAGQKPGDESKGKEDKQGDGKKKGEDGEGQAKQPVENNGEKQDPQPPAAARKIIRTGDIEFEIDSFQKTVDSIRAMIKNVSGAFIATIDSDKLANGKVRGSLVVRMPPDKLDDFLTDLRKKLEEGGGELKNQRIGSQDITKTYYDIESRLRGARAMEERFINIIKTGKGEIKDLILAEKELGVWRTKIEEYEGEIRYYTNQVALSTLRILLTEKEIRAAAAMVVSEHIRMKIESEDVEKSLRTALDAIAEAKGRVINSDLKQHTAGQYEAVLCFEVAPAEADKIRAKLKTLGLVAEHSAERTQRAVGGADPTVQTKTTLNNVRFEVLLQNLANIQPREAVILQIAVLDVATEYRKLQDAVDAAKGQVRVGQLNEQEKLNVTADLNFDVLTPQRATFDKLLSGIGEILARSTTRAAPGENATDSKAGFRVKLLNMATVKPRESYDLSEVSGDVPAAFRKLQDAIGQAKGQIKSADLNEQEKVKAGAELTFDVPTAGRESIEKVLAEIGEVYSRTTNRAAPGETASDRKIGYKLTIKSVAAMPAREKVVLAIEVKDVELAAGSFKNFVKEKGGRVVSDPITLESNGQVTGILSLSVPMSAKDEVMRKVKDAGIVRASKVTPNSQAPATKLATVQIEVLLETSTPIVPSDEGIWPQVRTSLSYSFKFLTWSLSFIILGLCVALPWALLLWVMVKLIGRWWKKSPKPAGA